MTDPYIRRLETYLRALEKRLVEVDQRLARVVLTGKVSDVRKVEEDWQVRTELGKDPDTGELVKSPWVPVQPVSGGDLKIKVKPVVGERMMMLSPSGVIGTGSWAIRGPFDEDHPAPAGDEDLIIERGKTRIVLTDKTILATAPDKVTALAGDSEVELKPGHVNVVGGQVHTVGRTHLAVAGKDAEGELMAVAEGLVDAEKVKIGPSFKPDAKVAELESGGGTS